MTDIRQSIRDNVVTVFTGLSTTDLRNEVRHHGGGIFVARDKLKIRGPYRCPFTACTSRYRPNSGYGIGGPRYVTHALVRQLMQ